VTIVTGCESSPIIIIGAARSGTKLLRRIIAESPGVVEIPFDINYIWRLGNMAAEDDALPAAAATPAVARAIHEFFARYRGGRSNVTVVEKTVSNCLRVPFVGSVFPAARFVHLIRDGRDVTASAAAQWRAPLRWREVLKKLRGFPYWRARRYAFQYVSNYVDRLTTVARGEKRVRNWGPVYPGLPADVRTLSLAEVCAWQWRHCVEFALRDLAASATRSVIEVRYEDLVRRPRETMTSLHSSLDLEPSAGIEHFLETLVRVDTIGTWRQRLSGEEKQAVLPILSPTLEALDYPTDED
jgi:hypothetical protein